MAQSSRSSFPKPDVHHTICVYFPVTHVFLACSFSDDQRNLTLAFNLFAALPGFALPGFIRVPQK